MLALNISPVRRKKREAMKKALLSVLLLGALVLPSYSLGIGAAFTPNFGFTSNVSSSPAGAALTLKLDSAPYVFGFGASLGTGYSAVGFTADLWMAKGKLIDFLNYYAGPGIYLGLAGNNNDFRMNGGLRIPIGVNAFLLNNTLELFLELAPAFGILLADPVKFPTLGLQGAFGFRFWF